jgi:prepilin-type N-terminal cleavage/methylation domain-containing protein
MRHRSTEVRGAGSDYLHESPPVRIHARKPSLVRSRIRDPHAVVSDAPDATCVRHRRGFSLIEVLGAVAILGIWYVILASLAMQGMRLTGESQRRLRASLIADRILADFELMAAQGEALEASSEVTCGLHGARTVGSCLRCHCVRRISSDHDLHIVGQRPGLRQHLRCHGRKRTVDQLPIDPDR